jgi:Lsr2
MMPSATAMLIDNAGRLEASETVRFGVDGRVYEIDLPARRARELRSMVGRYISVARKIPARVAQDEDEPAPTASMAATEADVRGGQHGLTGPEQQELRAISEAAKPQRDIVAGRLRTKGLADRDTAGHWWLTDAGRRELASA